MNKKILLLIISLATAIFIGVAVALFSGKKKTYLSALPKGAAALARVEVMEFLEEADLSQHDKEQLLERWLGTNDVQHLGLDFGHPVYAFSSRSGNFGFLAAVSDADDLDALCQRWHNSSLISDVVRQRGLSWAVVKQQWLMAFDGKKALVMGPAVGAAQDQLRTEMARLMTQKPKESGMEDSLFVTLNRYEDEAIAIITPEWLPEDARQLLKHLDAATSENALLALKLAPDENELTVEAEILPKSSAAKVTLKAIEESLRPIKGELFDYTHEGAVASISLNMQGKNLLEALRSVRAVRTALVGLNLVFDIDHIISSIDGDIVVEEMNPDVSLMKMNVSMLGDVNLLAHLGSTDFLGRAGTWGNSLVGVKQLSPSDFSLSFTGDPLYFGVNDEIFYFSGRQGLKREGKTFLPRHAAEIRGERFFANFKASVLFRQLGLASILPSAFDQVEQVRLEMEQPNRWELTLEAPEGIHLTRLLLVGE
ncbi:MAG: DUF4836 family protein [Bacteroidales bacterium]|nr:DUF4836 family protein [Bacteroidales bacterium]